MKSVLSIAVLIAGCGTAVADEKCWKASSTALTPVDWSIEAVSDITHRITFTLLNTLPKAVRMVEVEVGFVDNLGETIGALDFGRDHEIAAGAEYTVSLDIGARVFPRLPALHREDVEPYVCTRGVIYEDGTKETFE